MASAGFEPANLGTKGHHATPRPPKPLKWSYIQPIYLTAYWRHCEIPFSLPLSLSFCSTQFAPNQEDMKACQTRRQRFPYLTGHSFIFVLFTPYLFTDAATYHPINMWSANNRGSVCGVIFLSRFLSGGTEENSEKPQSRRRSCGQELLKTLRTRSRSAVNSILLFGR